MKVSELIKRLKSENPNAEVVLSDTGFSVIKDFYPDRIKKLYEIPKYDPVKGKLAEIPLLEAYDYGQLAYAGRNEINKIYDEMGWDWERRFMYILSFCFAKNWCHLFIDFRCGVERGDKYFGVERSMGDDIVKVPATEGWVPEDGRQSIHRYEKNNDENQFIIPERFKKVHYKGSRIPGVKEQENLALGANCQVYVYELLKEFNKEVPNFRSSDLWEDTVYTKKVETDFLPLDIMLYNNKRGAFGAHLALYIGYDKVLHLSKDNETPMVETHEAMRTQRKYRYFIGTKRIIKKSITKLNSIKMQFSQNVTHNIKQ